MADWWTNKWSAANMDFTMGKITKPKPKTAAVCGQPGHEEYIVRVNVKQVQCLGCDGLLYNLPCSPEEAKRFKPAKPTVAEPIITAESFQLDQEAWDSLMDQVVTYLIDQGIEPAEIVERQMTLDRQRNEARNNVQPPGERRIREDEARVRPGVRYSATTGVTFIYDTGEFGGGLAGTAPLQRDPPEAGRRTLGQDAVVSGDEEFGPDPR